MKVEGGSDAEKLQAARKSALEILDEHRGGVDFSDLVLRYSGAPRDAIGILRRAMEDFGEQTPLLLELAKAQFASALTADSRETLLRLRDLTPEDWQVFAMLAMLEDNKGRFVEAV